MTEFGPAFAITVLPDRLESRRQFWGIALTDQ